MLVVNSQVRIPLAEFEFTFARSSGPGGQNVNKVNSKAVLRWGVRHSPALPEAVRQRFLQKYAARLTNEGDLLVTSQRYRDAPRNVAGLPGEAAGDARWRSPIRPSAAGRRGPRGARSNGGSRPSGRQSAAKQGRRVRTDD